LRRGAPYGPQVSSGGSTICQREGAMSSAEREPIAGVWRRSGSQEAPPPLKVSAFSIDFHTREG